jgi:hypothetical protein
LSASAVESVEQAGVEALLKEDVGGDCGLHHFLGYSREGYRVLHWGMRRSRLESEAIRRIRR